MARRATCNSANHRNAKKLKMLIFYPSPQPSPTRGEGVLGLDPALRLIQLQPSPTKGEGVLGRLDVACNLPRSLALGEREYV